jgi:carboxymethylenebutenolidase
MAAETITLDTPDGAMPTYSSVPSGPIRGGIIVLQDTFGVTGYLEGVCDDLAAAGWHALAPHLFHRTGGPVVPFDRIEDSTSHRTAMTGAGILADTDACLDRFAAGGLASAHVGAMGFCMGGTIGFFLDTRRDLGAVVSFYGHLAGSSWDGVPSALDTYTELRAPWLGQFGDEDAMIPIADVEALRASLAVADLDIATSIIRYPGANHAFHRKVTPDWYHAASADAAWSATLTWFDAHMPAVGAASGATVRGFGAVGALGGE